MFNKQPSSPEKSSERRFWTYLALGMFALLGMEAVFDSMEE